MTVIDNGKSNNQPSKIQFTAESHQGIIPHPSIMQGYADINQNYPDRIMGWTDDNLMHERSLQNKIVNLRFAENLMNNVFGLIVAIVICYVGYQFMLNGYPGTGCTIICTTILGAIGIFVTRKLQEAKSEKS